MAIKDFESLAICKTLKIDCGDLKKVIKRDQYTKEPLKQRSF